MIKEKNKYLKWTLLPYFGSWVFGLAVITFGSVVTAIVRRTVDADIELIPPSILNYSLDLFNIYVWVPVAWLLGNSGIRLMELYVQTKTGKAPKKKDITEND